MTNKITLALCAVLTTAMAFAGNEVRVGIIGLDTSHSPKFAELLNGEKKLPEAKGFRVSVAYPWGSRKIESSYERIPKYTEDVKKLGVEIVDSIPALLAKCDCVLLETNDGTEHLAQALEVFKAGKPVFIDKPLAASLKDCVAIVEAAKKYNAKWFTASSLRYLTGVQAARRGEYGKVRGIATTSPESYEPTHSLFYWYAIHGAEPIFAALGRGCETVCCLTSDDGDVIIGKWADGKLSEQRALQFELKGSDGTYGGLIYTEQGAKDVGKREGYDALVVRILEFFRTGVAPIDPEETLEIFAYMEAAAQSRAKGGAPVALKDVLAQAGAEPGTFANPVIRKRFPDPTFWLGDDGWYYGTATGLATIHRSRNYVDWEDTGVKPIDGEELDELKRFSKSFWAPDAIRIGKTHYLYFTQFISSDSNRLVCATSDRPGGPFKVRSIVMESWRYGKKDCAIDAEVVEDNGKLWLFIGSVAGGVWRTRLTPDGLKVDPAAPLEHVAGLIPARDWRAWIYTHHCYEGSYLYRRDGWWYLFLSCGAIDDGSYRLFVGRSETLDGVFRDRLGVPLTEAGGNPLLVTDPESDFSGPGHNGEIITDKTGHTYMFIHSQWKGLSDAAKGGNWRAGTRCTSLQEILWDKKGWPYFKSPSLLSIERRPVME